MGQKIRMSGKTEFGFGEHRLVDRPGDNSIGEPRACHLHGKRDGFAYGCRILLVGFSRCPPGAILGGDQRVRWKISVAGEKDVAIADKFDRPLLDVSLEVPKGCDGDLWADAGRFAHCDKDGW